MQSLEMSWVHQIIAAGIAKEAEIKGCSDNEIATLENHFGVKLPSAYKAFLRVMGKGVGLFLNDCSITYPDIMEFRDQADDLAKVGSKYRKQLLSFSFMIISFTTLILRMELVIRPLFDSSKTRSARSRHFLHLVTLCRTLCKVR